MESIWLLRDHFWMTLGLHMAAQRLHMAAHGVHVAAQRLHLGALGAAYGRSRAPYGCPWGCIWLLRGCIWLQRGCILLHRGRLWLPCADMQYMLHLAGPGWAARIQTICPVEASQGGLGPYTDSLEMEAQDCKMHTSRLKTEECSSTQG